MKMPSGWNALEITEKAGGSIGRRPVYKHLCAVAEQEMLRPYVAFQATLRSAYHAFVLKLEEECKMLLNHQLQVSQA